MNNTVNDALLIIIWGVSLPAACSNAISTTHKETPAKEHDNAEHKHEGHDHD